ncbi:MAG TPA: hypothetical protein VKU41_11775 [Polyangiaceae bacterium]|nr:hypothetical protein [Polyangiaceae bacterium]
MAERKHADLWNELVAEAGEDEIDRAASVSVAQAEAELRAAGFDVAAERAKAGAFLEALEKGPGETKPAPRVPEETRPTKARPPRRPVLAWLAAAASFGALAGGSLVAALEPAGVVTAPRPARPSPEILAAAADLRRQASTACDAKQWAVCLADLDAARAVDPDGDDEPVVQAVRGRALAAILAKP